MAKVVIESRAEVVDLAKALLYLQSEGVKPRTRSELISLCISAISSLYTEKDLTEEESLGLLRDAFGGVNLGRLTQGRAQIGTALRKNLQASHIATERAEVPQNKEDMVKAIEAILKKGE